MLTDAQGAVENWISSADGIFVDAMARFKNSPELVARLIGPIREGRAADVEQYRAGWTSPEVVPWKTRHPTLHDLLMVLVGALVGTLFAMAALPKIDVANAIGNAL